MENLERLSAIKLKVQADREIRHREDSRSKLVKTVSQKVRTTMIGSLNAVEKRFGFLWGLDEFGRDSGQPLTEEQIELKNTFSQLRSDILDLGNNQIRNLDTELGQYDVNFNRYKLDLPVKPTGQGE